ncbi:MAG: hypothetical protein JNK04_10705 [Myxococcales bacterium]|nr:hypothetical protein [Myxococcales bacterium]
MSGPRARTLARMKLLLGGVALGAACSDPGYGVVDPMPPPARCETPIGLLTGNARFEKQPDGTFHLVVLVVLPANTDLRFSQTAPSAPAHQLTHRVDANGLELRTPISPVEKAFNATIFLECGEGPANASVAAFWSEGDPAAGSVVPLQINGRNGYGGGSD